MIQDLDEALKTLGLTLEKYKKNKSLVPKQDLEGKYKVPFQKLKEQLKKDLQNYIEVSCLQGIAVYEDEADGFIADFNSIYKNANMADRIGCAAFKNYDLEEVKVLVMELKQKTDELYVEYILREEAAE